MCLSFSALWLSVSPADRVPLRQPQRFVLQMCLFLSVSPADRVPLRRQYISKKSVDYVELSVSPADRVPLRHRCSISVPDTYKTPFQYPLRIVYPCDCGID